MKASKKVAHIPERVGYSQVAFRVPVELVQELDVLVSQIRPKPKKVDLFTESLRRAVADLRKRVAVFERGAA